MDTLLKILVVQPSCVGDAVMATRTLRAIRQRYPNAHISYLLCRYVKQLYQGMPWHDQLITYRTGKTKAKTRKSDPSPSRTGLFIRRLSEFLRHERARNLGGTDG